MASCTCDGLQWLEIWTEKYEQSELEKHKLSCGQATELTILFAVAYSKTLTWQKDY